jgi:DNA-binding transcriptional ArsR family regulator
MHEGTSIARVAALMGERGRAQILGALMCGRALTATELADAAGVTRPTVSSHLNKLQKAHLIAAESQGRHRYFRLASSEVAQLLESMMAAEHMIAPVQSFGPRDPELRRARVCYDHLAGEIGVAIFDAMQERALLRFSGDGLAPTDSGWALLALLGISAERLPTTRRPLCRTCLDWSERRHHLAGTLGAALLTRMTELRWAKVPQDSRIVRFSQTGEKSLRSIFGI